MRQASRTRRRGWTFVEVLVIAACLLLVLALCTPAVVSARGDARREMCRNNLKQFGLALHNYHDVHKTFPPGWVTVKFEPNTGSRFGWLSSLLPYVEQNPLYRQLDFEKPLPAANHVLKTTVPVYHCPDDPMPATNPLRGNYGTSNYSGNFGTATTSGTAGETLAHWIGPLRARYWPGQRAAVRRTNGIFFVDSRIAIRDLIDGTSKTFLVGERSAKSGAGIWPGIRSNELTSDVVTDCSPGNELNSGFNSFSSYHPGGANFVLGDGRTMFISNTIDATVYRAYSARDDASNRAIEF